jgi:hypothetical protein
VIKRTDRNHREISTACKQIPGVSYFNTHEIGKGFPDIVIGYKGKNYLVEIKDGTKAPSQRKLTKAEAVFHESWTGQIATITSVDDLLTLLRIK